MKPPIAAKAALGLQSKVKPELKPLYRKRATTIISRTAHK